MPFDIPSLVDDNSNSCVELTPGATPVLRISVALRGRISILSKTEAVELCRL